MRRVMWMCALLGALAFPQVATAQHFGEIRLGAYFPQKGLLRNADTGLAFEFGWGYRYSEWFAGELMGAGILTSTPSVTLRGGKSRVLVIPVTANAVLSRRLGVLRPYAKVGGGYFYAECDEPLRDQEGGGAVGAHVGAGLAVDKITIEYKYMVSRPKIGRTTFDVSGSVVSVGVAF